MASCPEDRKPENLPPGGDSRMHQSNLRRPKARVKIAGLLSPGTSLNCNPLKSSSSSEECSILAVKIDRNPKFPMPLRRLGWPIIDLPEVPELARPLRGVRTSFLWSGFLASGNLRFWLPPPFETIRDCAPTISGQPVLPAGIPRE